ncbi:MAG: MBL fold metallo-hydrolase [Thermomicrobiales bacterium]
MTTLTVLGGSAAGVGTGQGCAGFLVEQGQSAIVLDLGPNTLLELRKHVEMRSLDGIVISHLHMDHMLDILALRFALDYAPVPYTRRLPLWLPPGGFAFFARAADAFAWEGDSATFFTSVFDMHEYDPDGELILGEFTVTFHRTEHSVPCWAMRVRPTDAQNGDLIYTADTANTHALESFAHGATVVLSESTLPETPPPGADRPHSSAEEAADLAISAGAGTLVLTHIWEEDNPERSVELAQARFTGPVVLAMPGVKVTW